MVKSVSCTFVKTGLIENGKTLKRCGYPDICQAPFSLMLAVGCRMQAEQVL